MLEHWNLFAVSCSFSWRSRIGLMRTVSFSSIWSARMLSVIIWAEKYFWNYLPCSLKRYRKNPARRSPIPGSLDLRRTAVRSSRLSPVLWNEGIVFGFHLYMVWTRPSNFLLM